MKWWGWGAEGAEFTDADKPDLAPFIQGKLGLDVRRVTAPPPSFGSLRVPDTQLTAPLRTELESVLGPDAVSTDALDRVVHGRGKSLRDLIRQRRGDLPRIPDVVVRPVSEDAGRGRPAGGGHPRRGGDPVRGRVVDLGFAGAGTGRSLVPSSRSTSRSWAPCWRLTGYRGWLASRPAFSARRWKTSCALTDSRSGMSPTRSPTPRSAAGSRPAPPGCSLTAMGISPMSPRA